MLLSSRDSLQSPTSPARLKALSFARWLVLCVFLAAATNGSALAKLPAPASTSELVAGERKAAEKFDGALAYVTINKTANAANDVYSLPYIHGANHLISKNKAAYDELQFDISVKLSGLDFQGSVLTFSGPNLEQMRQEYESLLDQLETSLITWQQEQLTNPSHWIAGEIAFDNIREQYLTDKIALAEFQKMHSGYEFVLDVTLASGGQVGGLTTDIYYEFDVWDKVIDPIVYSVVDVLGVVPGVDFIADGIGALYSVARGNGQETLIYSAALALPFVGAAVIHSGQKVFAYYAKRNTQATLDIVVHQWDEAHEGWVKISNDIPYDDANKTSVKAELEAKKNLLDNETTEKVVELGKVVNGVGGLITTATKAITKQRLPNSFMEALKKFGKTEDDILEYFTDYHNGRSGQKFLNEIEDFISSTNPHNLTRDEAFALWGYTTNYFYKDMNAWLRNSENILQTTSLKNLISSGLSKLPNYSGQNVFRGISIESNKLQNFLSSYKTGATHTWDDFTSCGGSQAASFSGRPDVNIIFEIQHATGKEISDLADGIKYGSMARPEILIKAESKFEAVSDPIYDALSGKWKIKVIQTQ